MARASLLTLRMDSLSTFVMLECFCNIIGFLKACWKWKCKGVDRMNFSLSLCMYVSLSLSLLYSLSPFLSL